ncbi:lovastatin nonaketide synthase [Xylaria telfairii]|nr:lovastatin nonaketide synthase [Xylaria telfairii]
MNGQQQPPGTETDELIPLAIVGLAFDFPQNATSAEKLWEIVSQGRSTSTEFPSDRLNIDAYYHPDGNRPSTLPVRGGHFIAEDPGAFDAPFFSITPSEAACMDPQHRRLLEVSYHALEDAGISIHKCIGSNTSVYTGCFTNDYLSILQQDYDAEQRHAALGVAPTMLANRISWFYNFKGTSMNLDSACSSSLVALHIACQDLRAGNSSMALIGGSNMVYHPNFMKIMSDFNFLSPDSQCWSFDQRANGYARGEGIAFIIVKRLDDALRDGDTIRAVIRNTGSNQDGHTPAIMQPSEEAQINLINDTYEQGGIDMEPTRYFEAHATGTSIGDPIEGNAVGKTFQKYRSSEDPLFVGAIKANLGHLEGCSGIAGVIKTVLVLENGEIPPIAGLKTLNSKIDANSLHLHFPTSTVPWPKCRVRRACVNSFGFGGTNATAILDDAYSYLKIRGIHGHHRTQLAPALNGHTLSYQNGHNGYLETSTKVPSPKLFVWSAPDEDATLRLSDLYREYLPTRESKWSNITYTLATKRSRHQWKAFAVLDSENNLSSNDIIPTKPVKGIASENARVAFVFTGQGAQYRQMGIQLCHYAIFRESIASCDNCLKQLGCPWALLDVINCDDESVDINLPEYSQPLTTCLQIALVDLLRSLGVMPSVVLGHSSGEIAASYAAGVLSRSSAVKVAFHRGRLSSRISTADSDMFTMMAVGLSREKVGRYIDRLKDARQNVTIACINSPQSVTLSGRKAPILQLQQWLEAEGIFARKLRITLPYHTHFMEEIVGDYISALGKLEVGSERDRASMISSVSGQIVTTSELASAGYWVKNLVSPVEFEACYNYLLALVNSPPTKARSIDYSNITHVLEVGPHSALQGPIRETQTEFTGYKELDYVATLVRGEDASVAFLKAMGRLYCAGYPLDLLKANDIDDSPQPMPSGMPRYPFDHSQRYWIESSLSHNLRFRGAPRHDLLGTRNLDWNPYIAQWRNIMRLVELPWLQDHNVGSKIVVPAAGMMAMAIEGLQQLIPDKSSQRGIHIRDVNLLHAMSFAYGVDRIETQLTLSRPSQTGDQSSWSQFRLFMLEDGDYIECCNGLIRAVFDPGDHSRVILAGPWARESTVEAWRNRTRLASQQSKEDPYNMPPGCEIRYGSTFQNLEKVKLGPHGEVIAQLKTQTWSRRDTSSFAQPYVIHPTTLDGLAQPLFQALAAQRPGGLPTMMPVRVKSIWISNQYQEQQLDHLEVDARCRFFGYRGGCADVLAFSQENHNTPLVCVEGLETAFIDTGNYDMNLCGNSRRLCMKFVWKPDLEMMDDKQIFKHCTQDRPPQPPDAVQMYQLHVILLLCYIDKALNHVEQHKDAEYEWQFEYYISWMRYQRSCLQSGEAPVAHELVRKYLDDGEELDRLESQVESSDIDGFFFVQIGRRIIQMLRGEIDPLEVIFKDGLADQYYEKMLGNEHHSFPASAYVDLLSFKNPSITVLEVGAGTGGQTKRLLETMSNDGVSKWSRYDYTDISPSFFEAAREKFAHFGNVNFQIFDVSKDPASQNFEVGQYDLVIASHVLHATEDLDVSLRNVRKLLKPNGKLLLFETTRPEAIPVGFAFGLLKGWWSPLNHETRSPFSPCLRLKQWDSILKDAGFSGVDIEIPGQEEPYCRDSSIIISTAKGPSTPPDHAKSNVYLVVKDDSEIQSPAIMDLGQQLSEIASSPCKAVTLPELAASDINEDSLTIMLNEVDSAFLDGISETGFNNLQSVLVRSKNTVWVTRADPSMEFDPRHHLAVGLGRALTAEDASRRFLTLSLDPLELDPVRVAKAICDATRHVLNSEVDNIENSIVVTNGHLQICRITENTSMDKVVSRAIQPYQIQEHRLSKDAHLGLRFETPGDIDSVQWVETDIQDDTPPQSDEITVQVRAVGLTYKDYLIAKGQLNETNIGAECAGIVTEAGVDSAFQMGDRVCLISEASTAQSVIRVMAQSAVAIPDHIGFAEAASLASTVWLSYQALIATAHLSKDEIVLVYQGASCDGDIPIQVAQSVGARVLVTVNAPSQAEHFRSQYGLSDADIIYTDDKPLLQEVLRATGGEGVDLIIGALVIDGKSSDADFTACLAPFGRLIDISLVSQETQSSFFEKPRATANTSKTSIDMVALLRENPVTGHKIFQRAMKYAFDHKIQAPSPIHRFPAREAKAAFRHFERAWAGEKRILELDHSMSVTATIKTKPKYTFPENSTYIIGGGLGGLGRSFARWLVSRGARHLILVSRSGPRSEAAKTLVDELQSQGAQVATPSVDLVDLEQVKAVLENLSRSMPPIKGCIQATVALRDALFENMKHEDWVVAVNSKAASSWNLHLALPSGLDFFITLSSINGIMGGRAQANYTAGNTFKDGLAHHRISKGKKAITFDLGLMVSEGIVAQNADLLANMRRIGHLMDISQGELLALLDYYCDPSLPILTHEQAQILVGLETVSAVRAKKIDLHHIIHRPLFRQLFQMDTGSTVASKELVVDHAASLRQVSSDEEAGQLVTEWYQSKVAHMLGLKVEDVDAALPVRAYGMDSLMAIDLKNWFSREMGADIQVFHLLGNKSLAAVAREVAEISSFRAA